MQRENKLIVSSPTNRMIIPVERLGYPGVRAALHVVPQLIGNQTPDEHRLNDQTLRSFRVSVLLGKFSPDQQEIDGDFKEDQGDSFFQMPPGTELMKFETSSGNFVVHKNATGEMSMVDFNCDAIHFADCRQKFFSAAMPALDRISFVANIPIYFRCVRIQDVKNEVTTIEYVGPYRTVSMPSHIVEFPAEMVPLYALYREAKNAHSDFYRFLCLFKLLEGIFGKRHSDIVRRARSAGVSLIHSRLTVPSHPELANNLQQHVGKPMQEFVNKVLRKKFRDVLAHFEHDDGTILNMSDPVHKIAYSDLILVTELCTRAAIEEHERLLKQIVRPVLPPKW